MSEPRFNPKTTTRLDIRRPSPDLLAQASALPAATLHEAAGKIGVMPPAIKPVAPGFRICGPALTVHAPGGDNLWLHRAIYAADPGDVLVVSVGDAYEYGYWGEVMSTAALARGLGGLVINGCVRDQRLLAEMGFPVYARGLCIRGTGKGFGARGWINAPTRFDDVTVEAGDLIVADEDGVVAIPVARVAEVIAAAQAREAKEADQMRRIREGESTLAIFGWDE
ncbi:4-carboxy-4-hydroxy-2-oxoadipate aldolase/oxaloacetate decarboxylase [Paraburkholderia youngii]|uniref:Putative 4-hydroxy-4-methyl-2-oxoglutarate aldolase n=1 Tax=Paraburkholderia youngii TaxID=2782701 RepID=A0A7Y6K7A0_9BURK|nr:4-carboxy-4-hydroxy-2-oxoadipate aldolase/oxaloacetate decarboxylase [Paraburkholderia youngii]NUY05189.1 4-carboxy-4-hydroxy-2-oxoadipate aldolase/oxaloacetate decarboxylase [Paraburkholderia youngii]